MSCTPKKEIGRARARRCSTAFIFKASSSLTGLYSLCLNFFQSEKLYDYIYKIQKLIGCTFDGHPFVFYLSRDHICLKKARNTQTTKKSITIRLYDTLAVVLGVKIDEREPRGGGRGGRQQR